MKVVGFNVSRDESKAKLCWLNWIDWQVFPRERFERYYSAICRFPSIKFQFFFFFFFFFLIFLKFFFSILFSGLLQVVNIVRKKCTIETGAHISFFEWPRLFFFTMSATIDIFRFTPPDSVEVFTRWQNCWWIDGRRSIRNGLNIFYLFIFHFFFRSPVIKTSPFFFYKTFKLQNHFKIQFQNKTIIFLKPAVN